MNSTQLKFFVFVLMVLEHFCKIFQNIVPSDYANYAAYIGRIVAPVFWYLSIIGLQHTRNKQHYLIRLFTFSILMYLGNFLLSTTLTNLSHFQYNIQYNMFPTLFLGVLSCYLLDLSKQENNYLLYKLGSFLAFSLIFFTEGQFYAASTYLVFYFFKRKTALSIAYCLLCLCFFILLKISYQGQSFWNEGYQWMMVLALPFILIYNNKIGTYRLKYFFYAMYPLHIWIFFIINTRV